MFTLAHLSDPHLPLPDPRWHELLSKRITGYLNWKRVRRLIHDPTALAAITADLIAAKPDHIAITGDFVNISLPQEFIAARAWIEQRGTPANVTIIPGNHDAYVRSAMNDMRRAYNDYMLGDDGSAGFPFLQKRGPLALIGLSTALPTPPFDASGTLGNAQIAAMERLLAQTEDSFRVVLIHHPPVSTRAANKRLRDSEPFLAAIGRHGAELILHGHDHTRALVWLEGPRGRIPAIGVPSASAAANDAKPAAYNLYRIAGQSGAWRCEMEMRGLNATGRVNLLKRVSLLG